MSGETTQQRIFIRTVYTVYSAANIFIGQQTELVKLAEISNVNAATLLLIDKSEISNDTSVCGDLGKVARRPT